MTARTLIPAAAVAALCAVPAGAAAALPTGNLVKNPGAEQAPVSNLYFDATPVPDWNTTATPKFKASDVPPVGSANDNMVRADAFPATAGCRLFFGGTNPSENDDAVPLSTTYRASQEIAVPAEAIGQQVRLSALLGVQEDDEDYAQVTLEFLDAAGFPIPLSSVAVAIPPNDTSPGSLVNSTRFEQNAVATEVPSGTVTMRVVLSSTATYFGLGPAGAFTNGYIDNVGVTFDATDPAPPAAGCKPPGVTTGDATNITPTTAKVSGTVEGRGEEDTEWILRVGPSADQPGTAAASGVPTGNGPETVSGEATGLEPNTTYYYHLEAKNKYPLDEPVLAKSEVKSFKTPPRPTTPPGPIFVPKGDPGYKFNTFAGAVTIARPKGGCVKKGTTFKVTVRDAAMGVRNLRRFIVLAGTGIGTPKQTTGPIGKPFGSVTVRKMPTKAPKNTRGAKLILTVIADFDRVVDEQPNFSSSDSVSGSKQFKFCKKKKRRR